MTARLVSDEQFPPMPENEAEWRAHWAVYRLTVAQRDAAWREIERLQQPAAAPGGEG